MMIQIISLLFVVIQAQLTELPLSIRYSDNFNQWIQIGTIKISKSNWQSAQILLTNEGSIIDRKRITSDNIFASLRIVSKTNVQYIAHIDAQQMKLFNTKANYQEFVQLVVSNGQLISFDYALKQIKKGTDSSIQIVTKEMEMAPQIQIAQQQQDEKEEQQTEQPPQGIFGLLMQYKWYIILGFAVFFLLGNQDPQKLNETVQQAQEQAQSATNRHKK